MKVAFLGSGNVATQMAIAFDKAGLNVTEIWSRQFENASILASNVNAKAVVTPEALEAADLYVVAIKDDEISAITNRLKNRNGIIVHTSGATPLNVFEGNFEHYGVFYPLQTFSKYKAVDFSTVPVCVEANSEIVLQTLEKIGHSLSKSVYRINSEARQTLHLAAVFACNFTNHLYALSNTLLAEKDLDFDLLRPLIKETADKVYYALPDQVQTGPAIRHDEQTMARHIAMLAEHPQLRDLYIILSNSIKNANG